MSTPLHDLEEQIKPALTSQRAFRRPARGWLRAVRETLRLSHAQVAKKLGTSRQSYAQLEIAEERGTISLNSLHRAANAMQCRIIYLMMPHEKAGPTFAALAGRHDPDLRAPAASQFSPAAEQWEEAELPQHMR